MARTTPRPVTASQLVAIATRSDTGSHNSLDLIQSFVPPHYVCNGYISIPAKIEKCVCGGKLLGCEPRSREGVSFKTDEQKKNPGHLAQSMPYTSRLL
jgi:hypothetical protein